jgi:hypothetical protein
LDYAGIEEQCADFNNNKSVKVVYEEIAVTFDPIRPKQTCCTFLGTTELMNNSLRHEV